MRVQTVKSLLKRLNIANKSAGLLYITDGKCDFKLTFLQLRPRPQGAPDSVESLSPITVGYDKCPNESQRSVLHGSHSRPRASRVQVSETVPSPVFHCARYYQNSFSSYFEAGGDHPHGVAKGLIGDQFFHPCRKR